MKIRILFRAPMRRWQAKLADALRARGHQVCCVAQGGGKMPAVGVVAALALQQRAFGPSPSLFDTVLLPPEKDGEAVPDLAVALDGATSGGVPSLEPLFDGDVGDEALLAMLTVGGTPTVRIAARCGGEVVDLVAAQLAVEDRNTLSRALDQTLARIVSLVVQGVGRFEQGATPLPSPASTSPRAPSSPMIHIARGLGRKIAGRLPGARLSPNDWRIAYRRRGSGLGAAAARAWRREAFTFLPGRADRFYADPMPFEHDGRIYLFFEDFPYATGKGVIGLVEIAANGTASAPRTVLEQAFHLSYPLILRHGDAIYMLPEMCAARRLQLFRADPFPDRWVPDRVLLEGCVVADATPVLHDGRWWLFATLSDDGGSSWDQLGLFHAPDLLGPWTAHDDNPVLVDAGTARPGGAMWHENGALMRVAQDCRDGYGRGLVICRVDRIDPRGYAQTFLARLGPPDGLGADGVHTLNTVDSFEVIDLRYPRHSAALRARARG